MSKAFLASAVFAAICYSAGAQVCPDDWIQFEDSCYVFIDERVPWTSAKVFCDILGAGLLEVNSQSENDFIAAMLRNDTHGIQGAWLGLTDMVREGRWLWLSSQDVPEFTNWDDGQPDNNHNHENGEDCVEVRDNGMWNDLWCEDLIDGEDYKPSPVCEMGLTEGEIIG